MAAGEGRRLRPLTECWPKPVLPIDGRPVVATLVRELEEAGFTQAWVVTGHLAEQVEALLGDGAGFGLEVRYVRQPDALGSADAVRRAIAAGAKAPLLVSAADTLFATGDLARACGLWEAAGTAGGIGVRRLAPPELREQTPVRVAQGLVTKIGGEPESDVDGTLTGAPLWFLGEGLGAALDDLPGPPFELAAAFGRALERGERISALPLGPTRDLTRPDDIVTRNFPYLWREERDG